MPHLYDHRRQEPPLLSVAIYQKIDFKHHCALLRLAFYRIQWRYQNFNL